MFVTIMITNLYSAVLTLESGPPAGPIALGLAL